MRAKRTRVTKKGKKIGKTTPVELPDPMPHGLRW